jgi:hypothetical protein
VEDGTYIYYVVQAQLLAKTPAGFPTASLYYYQQSSLPAWRTLSLDRPWSASLDPRDAVGPTLLPVDPAASADLRNTYAVVGVFGWHNPEYALDAMHRLQAADAEGDHDDKSGGRVSVQRRHRFRVLKVSVDKQSTVLSEEPLLHTYAQRAAKVEARIRTKAESKS